ncbi:cellulose binding domain-containing protein [Streptomyces winkii]|uniref:cellulose binding domain-containing protein n=1 Tax=Streptomyces winkii TaxID=3051178 RepID=UPI0028D43364|nr:cellulose binding domain-containing protein [Streptomyces sp. DSM 40971]
MSIDDHEESRVAAGRVSALRAVRAARAVPAGTVVALAVVLLGMTVVLRLAGAWPFGQYESVDARSVPDARLPLPPSAVGSGGSPSGRDGDARGRSCRAVWHADAWRSRTREGFDATVRIVNRAEVPVRGWEVAWKWPGRQRTVKGWNARIRDSGSAVTVRDGSGSAEIPAGGETTFGLQATGCATPAPRLTCRAL